MEIKYSNSFSPSLKLDVIGVSIISPEGFVINPLIPANCLIWAGEPLAPESDMIYTLFRDSKVLCLLFGSLGSNNFFIISDAITSVHFVHSSIALLYLSPDVINPSEYCSSYSLILL